MKRPMFRAGSLSGLNLRLGFGESTRARRRRTNRRLHVAAEVSLLEERCMLSSSVIGSHTATGPRHERSCVRQSCVTQEAFKPPLPPRRRGPRCRQATARTTKTP